VQGNISKIPEMPSDFAYHDDIKVVLDSVIRNFRFEEQQAIYFYHILGVEVSELAQVMGLSENHVVGVLNLYSEQLESKLYFFRKIIPHNGNDMLPTNEILFLEPPYE